MRRPTLLFAGLSLVALPGTAGAASYAATPAVRPAASRINAADISWSCGANACQGSSEESRPLVLCQDLAGRAGRLDAFLVDGSAFSAADLGRCNAKARNAATTAPGR